MMKECPDCGGVGYVADGGDDAALCEHESHYPRTLYRIICEECPDFVIACDSRAEVDEFLPYAVAAHPDCGSYAIRVIEVQS